MTAYLDASPTVNLLHIICYCKIYCIICYCEIYCIICYCKIYCISILD